MNTTRIRFEDDRPRTVTVVICAFTERRWDLLTNAVESLRLQQRPPEQIVVVIDHNPELLERAHSVLGRVADVFASDGPQGLSGARNTGVRHARGDVVAFLDDDAEADPRWLEQLLVHYAPDIAGTGGVAMPAWPGGNRPSWFPPEFDWVVGCSYVGLPDVVTPLRNLIGTAMSFRLSVFDVAGFFDTGMGRVGSLPLGCEETEFAIRLRRSLYGSQLLHVPSAVVLHHVSPERATGAYFVRRCYAEGISKALTARLAGAEQALSTERTYVRSTLPLGVLHGVKSGARGDVSGLARALMIGVGLLVTAAGFVAGRMRRGAVSTMDEQEKGAPTTDPPLGSRHDARNRDS